MLNEHVNAVSLTGSMCAGKGISFQPMHVAADVMTADVKVLTLDHTVQACLKFMKAYDVRHAPIMDLPNDQEDKPYFVGVVSQRDVLRLNSSPA